MPSLSVLESAVASLALGVGYNLLLRSAGLCIIARCR